MPALGLTRVQAGLIGLTLRGAPLNISRCLGGGVDAATLVAALSAGPPPPKCRWSVPAGLTPLCEVVAWASVGVDPTRMGIGPVPAIELALKRAGMTLDQVIYIHECNCIYI